jgi:3-deoxy-D-manno-octulosonic-acid transferase
LTGQVKIIMMRAMMILYNMVLFLVGLLLFPYFAVKIALTGKYRRSIGPKLGLVDPDLFRTMTGQPRIWVHAVSVGEVTAAAPIVAELRERYPQGCIVVSTTTETGRLMAERLIPGATAMIYFPLDIPCVVRKLIRLVRPDIFVPVETELWPNFLRVCRNAGIKVVMVNGRISPRSFKRYLRTRFFWKPVLAKVDQVGVISKTDMERIVAMGLPAEKVHIQGNAKYDGLAATASPRLQQDISARLNMSLAEKVWVVGSTHEGEETIVLNVYRRLLETHPDLKLILVPRHVERRDRVIMLIREAGFADFITMREINDGKVRRDERIVLIDVIGELFQAYSLAAAVYCGGSLVPKGGQNILEPAAWGKVVLYGPSMEDFTNEKALLEEVGAGLPVTGEGDLFMKINDLLQHPEDLRDRGAKGREAVIANMGAAKRYAAMIGRHLPANSPGAPGARGGSRGKGPKSPSPRTGRTG